MADRPRPSTTRGGATRHPAPTPARRSRLGRILVVATLLVALLVGVSVWVRLRVLDSPDRARRTYAAALASGDAGRLRSVLAPPVDALVAHGALDAMRTAGGLPTDVAVEGESVAWTVAGERRRVVLPVAQVDGRWRVTGGVAPLDLTGFPVVVAVDGQAITDRTAVALVPGTHVLTSADPLLAIGEQQVVVADPAQPVRWSAPTPALTDAGVTAVREAVSTSLRRCLARTGLTVEGCPQQATEPPALRLDSPVSWRLAGDDPVATARPALVPGTATARVRLGVPLVASADATRRYDATTTRYEQPVTVPATALVTVSGGVATVVWAA